jgi:ribonuclease P protein component
MRFQRRMRLLTARDYERVFQQPQKSSGKALTVLARCSGRAWARLGLAIPRKQIRRAVERNRIKRLIRESFRRHQDLLSGLDVVVIGRSDLAKKNTQMVFACLETHWRQLSERCKSSNAC